MPRITYTSSDDNISEQIADLRDNIPKSLSKVAALFGTLWETAEEEMKKGQLSDETEKHLLDAIERLHGIENEITGRSWLVHKFVRRAVENNSPQRGGGTGWPPC